MVAKPITTRGLTHAERAVIAERIMQLRARGLTIPQMSAQTGVSLSSVESMIRTARDADDPRAALLGKVVPSRAATERAAELTRERMEARTPRKCLRCRGVFPSEGVGNRLCQVCTTYARNNDWDAVHAMAGATITTGGRRA